MAEEAAEEEEEEEAEEEEEVAYYYWGPSSRQSKTPEWAQTAVFCGNVVLPNFFRFQGATRVWTYPWGTFENCLTCVAVSVRRLIEKRSRHLL